MALLPFSLDHPNRRAALQAGLGLALPLPSWAQNRTDQGLTLLVPYPPGGPSDEIARTLAPALSRQLGQPLQVQNLGGASGTIAAQRVLNQPSDGRLLFQGSPNELILAPLTLPSAKFRSEDFRLVQMISATQIGFLARANLPVNTVDGFLDYARQQVDKGQPTTYASVGPGSFYHLLGAHLSQQTGIAMQHVPYKGSALADQDLIAGQVDIFLAPYTRYYRELRRNGKLKVLAMLNPTRLEGVQDIPAIRESKALKDFVFQTWTGYFVKADTPEATVVTLHQAATAMLTDPATRVQLEALFQMPATATPLPLAKTRQAYADSIATFRALAKAVGV